MSFIHQDPAQVVNHPLNNSKAKMQYSFPHKERFLGTKQSGSCAVAFYDLPETKQRRTTSFGFGTKFDFTSLYAKTPGPGCYNVRKYDKDMKTGFSFGARHGSVGTISPSHAIPGPGTYDIRSSLSKLTCTLSPKTIDFGSRGSFLDDPGPGAYNVLEGISKTGHYTLWKFRGSGAPRIQASSKPSKGRPIELVASTPGPGAYEIPGINKTGNYFFSRYSSSKSPTFSRGASRSDIRLNGTPGPGSYLLPSEFGYPTPMKSSENSLLGSRSKSFIISKAGSPKNGMQSQGPSSANASTNLQSRNSPNTFDPPYAKANQQPKESKEELPEFKNKHYK